MTATKSLPFHCQYQIQERSFIPRPAQQTEASHSHSKCSDNSTQLDIMVELLDTEVMGETVVDRHTPSVSVGIYTDSTIKQSVRQLLRLTTPKPPHEQLSVHGSHIHTKYVQ